MMPILTEEPRAAVVHAISEVRVGIPIERIRQVRDFYVRLIGLAEWPQGRQLPGGWGAGDPRRGAYFAYRHDPAVEPMRRRIVVQVHSLDTAEERLREAGLACIRERGLNVSDQRILVSDPAGHLVELRQSQPF